MLNSANQVFYNLSDEWMSQKYCNHYRTARYMKPLLILTTGGTIDKVHDTLTEELVFTKEELTQIPELLKVGRCYFPGNESVLQKDSLDMHQEDRAAVLQAVIAAEQQHIVVTHGTGTIEQTAKYLDGKVNDKTIVLTGAMRPHSLGKSDAGFNLGGAIIAAQTLPAGVYVVMNGRVFEAAHVKKNVEAGRFDLVV